MAPGGQQQTDQTTNFFWLLCIIIGIALSVWWFDSSVIVRATFQIRVYEIKAALFFALLWAQVATPLHLPQINTKELTDILDYMRTAVPSQVSWSDYSVINTAIGRWARYPVIFVLLVLSAWVYFKGPAKYQNSYNMKSLRVVSQEVWPQITPVITLDLIKEDIDKGPWAMCQLPLAFCREHNLLLAKEIANKKVWSVRQKPAYRLFALQLGPMWPGLDFLPIHVKALALVFLARTTGQRPLANSILKQIAASAATGKLDFTGVSEQLKNFRDHKIIRWVEARHAYVTTFMATLLEIARSDGVLASAEFLWLKPVDRRLWFVLNNVGRRTAFVEVAGIYSHWIAEKKIGRALKTPMVKGAVDALDEALQNVLFVEASDRWHTSKED
jgi:intracellular multiplication protein IcmP